MTRGFSDLTAPSLSVWLSLRWFHSHFLASLGSLQLVVKWGSLAPDLQGYVTKTYVKKRESPFPRKESNDSAGPGVLVGIVSHSPSDCMRKEGQLCKAK